MGFLGQRRLHAAYTVAWKKHYSGEVGLHAQRSGEPLPPSVIADAVVRAEDEALFDNPRARNDPNALTRLARYETDLASYMTGVPAAIVAEAVGLVRSMGYFPRDASEQIVGGEDDQAIRDADAERRRRLLRIDREWRNERIKNQG